MNEFKEQKETKQKSTRRIYLKIIGLIVFIICFVLLAFATIRKPTNLNTTTKQVSIKKVYKPEKKEKSLNVSETPRPTPTIIKVSEKIKKDKLLQKHTVFHYSSYNRDNNLKVAAKMINGTVLLPKEETSFFEIIGEPNEKKGFKEAGVIINHKSATALAGGICEVATSLNTVAIDGGLKTNAQAHSINVGYLNSSDHEATVTYDGGIDLKINNTLKYPVMIKQKTNAGNVTSILYKVKVLFSVKELDVVTEQKNTVMYEERKLLSKYKLIDNTTDKNANKNNKVVGKLINCTLLQPGETFSFWKTIGDPKKVKQLSDLGDEIYKNSTSLNTSANIAGLKTNSVPISKKESWLKKECKESCVSYVSDKDLTVKNNKKYPILIKQYSDKGSVVTTILKLRKI